MFVGAVLVVLNVGEHVVSLAAALRGFGDGELIVSSAVGHDGAGSLPGNTCAWIRTG